MRKEISNSLVSVQIIAGASSRLIFTLDFNKDLVYSVILEAIAAI